MFLTYAFVGTIFWARDAYELIPGNCFAQKLFTGLETIFGKQLLASLGGGPNGPKITQVPYET